MLLSVVVVSYRDEPGLRRTLQSLEHAGARSRAWLEVLVQEGSGSSTLPDRYQEMFPWARVTSATDDGIYDAMNSGLHRSRGDYVWFLNGGDECALESLDEILPILTRNSGILLFNYERVFGSKPVERRARGMSYIRHALPTSHQAILYPGNLARGLQYDLSYPVAADYEFTARATLSGVGSYLVPLTLARFFVGGHSSTHRKQIANDAYRVQKDVLRTPFIVRVLSRLRHATGRIIADLGAKR